METLVWVLVHQPRSLRSRPAAMWFQIFRLPHLAPTLSSNQRLIWSPLAMVYSLELLRIKAGHSSHAVTTSPPPQSAITSAYRSGTALPIPDSPDEIAF